jgi:hypothetical protein
VQAQVDGFSFVVHTPAWTASARIGLSGLFNVENALAAVAIAQQMGYAREQIVRGLARCRVPGRMDVIASTDGDLTAIVDYAHNGMAVQKALESVRDSYPEHFVIAVFGAIDHTATVSASVNLANAEYYWMANTDIPGYTMPKYVVSDVIPASHYMSGYQINLGNAWVLSNTSPGLFIGKMDAASLKALCTNTDAFDETAGTGNISWAAKFPKANVVGAIEVFGAATLDAGHYRFPSDINTGYAKLTNQKGYSLYRNVDKEATEALPENAGKLVYNYALGTQDVDGSTDPSGIDAEASIAAGAHIVYLQTNDSGKDFHQRKLASLKK